ncbi:MAG: DUF3501 family protein [Rhodospirillales bacterium]|nr:DUF3501 family protein [Rhodospirillales bacterium]
MARPITAAELLSPEAYEAVRAERRRALAARKRNRRVEVGPFVTFYFECRETMLVQIQEMLRIEKGGAAQIPDELAAYNPLVPNGNELVATFMIEIDDPARRARVLSGLGGIEEHAFLRVGGETVRARPEADQDRTSEEGKASSVQFVHFDLAPERIATFRAPGAEIVLGFDHPNYRHMAVLGEDVRAELAGDFD